jgi:hypothetical protein
VGEATICTSIVVACELRYGAAKRGSSQLSERVESLLDSMEVLPLDKSPIAAMPKSAPISTDEDARSDPTASSSPLMRWFSV